jgi:hypothetical protein
MTDNKLREASKRTTLLCQLRQPTPEGWLVSAGMQQQLLYGPSSAYLGEMEVVEAMRHSHVPTNE